MSSISLRMGAAAVTAVALVVGAPAWASDEAIADIVEILRERGLIDEATEQQILVKSRTQVAPAVGDGFEFAEGIQWSGDLRVRNEQFWFDRAFGSKPRDRNRWNYRLRMRFTKPVNEFTTVGVRITSGLNHNGIAVGFGDSLAFNDSDFGNDPLSIDQAWARFALPETGWGLRSSLSVGKVANPFRWSVGKDYLLFDADITPEGFYWRGTLSPREKLELFGTVGYFIVDERSSGADPKVLALQLGGETELGGATLGGRVSWFEWRSLQRDFIARAADAPVAGTSGNFAGAFDGGRAQIGEISTYARLRAAELPLLLYGTWVRNFNARSTGPIGEEDTAFGLGIELGAADRWAKLGLAYFRVEANAVPSMFIDNNIFDADTNREGWVAYLERRLASRMTLKVTYFSGEALEDGPGFAVGDATASDRRRLQSDLILKF